MNFDEKVVDRIKKLEREVERLRVKESPGIWQDWTPTVTWIGTAPTTTTVTSARYCKVGKLVMFNVHLTIVKGSGTSTRAEISPPVTIADMASVASGRTTLHGGVIEGIVCPVSNSVAIRANLGTAMSSDGYVIITGFYEAA